MTLKQKVATENFQKLQKEYPKVDLSRIYTPISDEEAKNKQEMQIPNFLKTK